MYRTSFFDFSALCHIHVKEYWIQSFLKTPKK